MIASRYWLLEKYADPQLPRSSYQCDDMSESLCLTILVLSRDASAD
jgi:hypothetical protein